MGFLQPRVYATEAPIRGSSPLHSQSPKSKTESVILFLEQSFAEKEPHQSKPWG